MNLKTNPELLPLVEWWEKDGKQTVMWLVAAAIVVAGYHGIKHYRIATRNAASEVVSRANTCEELEEAVGKFSSAASAGVLKLRLAKSYYDAEKYDIALEQYEALVGNAPDGFADIPVVGRAQCLEALGKYDEAAKAFDDFATANPTNYLTLTAQLGAARAICQAGDKEKALGRIETLKAANKDDSMATSRIEATEKLIKRFEKKLPAAPVPDAPAPAEEPAKAE